MNYLRWEGENIKGSKVTNCKTMQSYGEEAVSTSTWEMHVLSVRGGRKTGWAKCMDYAKLSLHG